MIEGGKQRSGFKTMETGEDNTRDREGGSTVRSPVGTGVQRLLRRD